MTKFTCNSLIDTGTLLGLCPLFELSDVAVVDDVSPDLGHEFQEQLIRLEFVLDEWVALGVPAEAHGLLEELDGLKVFFPEVVRLGEHEEATGLRHEAFLEGVDLGLLLVVGIHAAFLQVLPELLVVTSGHLLEAFGGQVAHLRAVLHHFAGKSVERPLLGRDIVGNVGLEDVIDGLFGVLDHEWAEVDGLQGGAPVVVHTVTLGVEDLIVLEELLADVVEVRLDFALGLVQGVGEHCGFNGKVVDLECGHHALYFISSEDSEEIVLEGEEVPGGSWVSLAARTSTQLSAIERCRE